MTPAETLTLLKATMRAEGAVAERDRLICQAHANGASLRDIATATGQLSHAGVARIVKRQSNQSPTK